MNIVGNSPTTAEGNQGEVCPFLGLLDDPQTSLSYPSTWNVCHRAKPIAAPSLDHQQSYCLGSSYTICPVFIRSGGTPLPAEIQTPAGRLLPGRRIVWVILLAFVLLFGVAGSVWAFVDYRAGDHTSSKQTTNPTTSRSFTPSLTPSISATDTFLYPGVNIIPTETKTPQTPTTTPSATVRWQFTPATLTASQTPGAPNVPSRTPAATHTLTDTPKPPTRTPKPPTDTPKPPTDTPKPPTDTPKPPPTDTPVSPTDTPKPVKESHLLARENLAANPYSTLKTLVEGSADNCHECYSTKFQKPAR